MDLVAQFESDGFVKLPFLASQSLLTEFTQTANLTQTAKSPGKRHLTGLKEPIADLLNDSKLKPILEKIIGGSFRPVRTIFFKKDLTANWFVPWHQDLTVALKRKRSHPEFTKWTIKNNVPHAEAPMSLLSKMVTLRLFLDPANQDNGAMWVAPKSHKLGKLKQDKITSLEKKEVCFEGEKGALYLFSPLLLHRSEKSKTDVQRRALQIEIAPKNSLFQPLEWYENI